MKNEIGRKLTSLTLMTIMFAGGMTIAFPNVMPSAFAEGYEVSDGYITASSEFIQGGAILEVVISDPAYTATDIDIADGPDVTFGGTDYIATQGVDGKWYAYFVDYSAANDLDGDGLGMEYGIACSGLGVNGQSGSTSGGSDYDIVGSNTTVWAEAYKRWASNTVDGEGALPGSCINIDGAEKSDDAEAATTTKQGLSGRELLTDAVLANAPSFSQWDTSNNTDGGQRLHFNNATSGHGSWPFIFTFEFNGDNIIEYLPTGDAVNVEFGNADDETWISLANENPAESHNLHLSVGAPGLNIDPTTPDVWIFDLRKTTDISARWVNNGSTNGVLTDAILLANDCGDGCQIGTSDLDGDGSADTGVLTGFRGMNMTESTANSALFESFDLNGVSSLTVSEGAAADTPIRFGYGDNFVTMVVTYNDGQMTFDAPSANWTTASSATVTIIDPDLNKNPGDDETLSIGDETAKVPTIKMGSPLTLGGNITAGGNMCGGKTEDQIVTFDCLGQTIVGDPFGGLYHKGSIDSTDDHSERLRITSTGFAASGTDKTAGEAMAVWGGVTYINVTTTWSATDIRNLEGSAFFNYDITGATELMTGITDITITLVDSGHNGTANTGAVTGSAMQLGSGLASSGSLPLCQDEAGASVEYVCSKDVTLTRSNWGGDLATALGYQGAVSENSVGDVGPGPQRTTVAFKITHAGAVTGGTEFGGLNDSFDIAIAADICNFDQDNATDTHNCIYRLEAEETGDDTGVFEGFVEYVMLNNSTNFHGHSGAGVHPGNDLTADQLIGHNSDEITVVLMDSGSGTDSIRISYNDTDALQASEELEPQLDTSTHTGTVDLDANGYEADDMATITIVDADLNQDSEVRETYQNSTTTFQVVFTNTSGDSETGLGGAQTIIETAPSSGIFVGTFSVPATTGSSHSTLGQDMEITYYESSDASGEAIELYDVAQISSNDGDVSWDQSVYPVPFKATELYMGTDTAQTTNASDSGNVTATIYVTEPDQTIDSLSGNTSSTSGNEIVIVKLIQGATTTQIFTAGNSTAAAMTGGVAEELGPLTETVRNTMVYEVDVVFDHQACGFTGTAGGSGSGTNACQEIKSGDIVQVEYVDTSDSAGATSTFYDSSTFDLRTGTLSVDKDVYVIGSDFVVTLTDPDLNIESDEIQTYNLNLLEWDSDADSSELINAATDGTYDSDNWYANPTVLQETGPDTGVFQTVLTIPTGIYNGGDSTTTANTIDFGEEVTLTYVDAGLAGENDYGTDGDEMDIEASFSISNFGALVELNKAVYNWTDTVYVTITAPDHNQNTAAEETIGSASLPIQVTTRSGKMCSSTYKAVESDEDTGVFTAEIQLIGMSHQLSSDSSATGPHYTGATTCGSGDTDGEIKTASQTDGVSVSYEYNDGFVVVASGSIVWNIGEATFDTSSAAADGSAVVTVTDADENINDSLIDTFTVDVFSDSDNGGFQLTMNETDEDTGVFEGTVFFTTDLASSGSTLRVAEGDTVTAEYVDETLPEPYTTDDDLTIASTLTIGSAFPPLERAPAANARVVDSFGASVSEVSVDQQVQIAADVSNGQSGDQAFAYLVQVQDGSGVTVSLAWITGSLTAGQSMSPALSWTPDASGSYTATVFVWESVDNPTALSPTVSVTIDVV